MTKAETTFIHLKKKSCANLQSVDLSMTKYLLHGMTCNIAELLHLCGLMHSASPRALIRTRATILQCRIYIIKELQNWQIETEG